VTDPQLFVNTIVGTQQRFSTNDIQSFLRDVIVSRLNDVLGETLKTLLDLPRYYDELAVALKTRVLEDFDKYGLEVVDFYINSITPPEDVQKVIDERSGMAAAGNMNDYMRFKTARAIGDASKQEGGETGQAMGLGMGAGLGMMVPGMMQQAMQQGQQQQAGQTAKGPVCPKCQTQLAPGAQFCSNCGNKLSPAMITCPKCSTQLPADAKFCSSCGASLSAASVCSKCGTNLTSTSKFCPQCGEPVK
jgi:membrane protease subunit (stomatin/prohibitin family)